MGVMLEARGLGIGYPGKVVGRDIDLAIEAGKLTCLLGPNGSGKTTLFKTLLGLIPLQTGSVHLGEKPLSSLPRNDIARRIAYVPQAHASHFPYRVIDMVLMGRTAHVGLFATPSDADRVRARDALATFGIEDLAEAEFTRISGGQRQLALIARALAQDAPTIIMDEPTASLDFGNQVAVLREVVGLSSRGIAVVLSTHDPDHALNCADRVALLDGGGIVASGDPADVLTETNLQQVYGIEVAVETLQSGQRVCVPKLG